jgi:hypothetical protein
MKFIITLALLVGIVWGWVLNIKAIIGLGTDHIGELIVRLFGVPAFPLGALFGWFL